MEARLAAGQAGFAPIDPSALETVVKRIRDRAARRPGIAGELEKEFKG